MKTKRIEISIDSFSLLHYGFLATTCQEKARRFHIVLSAALAGCRPIQPEPVETGAVPANAFEMWVDNPVHEDDVELTLEFAQVASDVGRLGWHLELSYVGDVNLSMILPELDAMLHAAHPDVPESDRVVVENVVCIRFNVNYGSDHWLCEGNAYSGDAPHATANFDLNWPLWEKSYTGYWAVASEPGCSMLVCQD